MTKKIVAIGGGENGRYLGNGKYREYETEPMDKEIIRLTGKENPNYLFMVHAQPFNNAIEEGYFETMKKIYGDMFGCNCMYLKSTELDDMEVVKEKIAWADIIYEGGGNTLEMINLWKKTGFDKVLLDAYTDGKVLCGVPRPYHQLTKTHKVLGAKQHGITVSSSFEIQPVFLHSSSLFCHTLWLLKLEDPKELVLRAIQGRGAQYYWM